MRPKNGKPVASIDDVKNRILAQTPLDRLVGEALSLQSRAGRLVGCCPFHSEKTPSFYLYDDHYHCYGCGAHGDAISYVQHQQGLGFWEALKWLAQKYAIPCEELERPNRDLNEWKKNAKLNQVLLEAQEFFCEQLLSPAGEEARCYLQKRGFEEEQWRNFGLGYAPDQAQALLQALRKRGYQPAELEAASLVTSYQDRSFDFFRHRITVPIRDVQGRLVAFGGRALGAQQQKYKNSRYDKANLLFGLDRARAGMRQAGRGIIVEGYFDALKMQQFGFKETAACQGTALTREHIKSLKGATPLIYLLFDGDQAGQNASLKLITTSLDFPELRFKVALLPTNSDPDSFLRAHGSGAMEQLLGQAVDLIDYAITVKLQASEGAAIPSTINSELVPWLSHISDPIQRSFLCQKVAQLSGVELSAIKSALAGRQLRKATSSETQEEEPRATRAEQEERRGVTPSRFPTAAAVLQSPVTPASSFIFEWLGQLYFATPNDGLDCDELSRFTQQELQTDLIWLYFNNELLAYLRQGLAPATRDPNTWICAQSPEVAALITRLEKARAAFNQGDRNKMLRRLQLQDRQNKIKNTITSIKERMANLQHAEEEQAQQAWRHLGQGLLQLHQELRHTQDALRQT